MKIFISFNLHGERDMFIELTQLLKSKGHNAYPKQLAGFFGSKGLHDTDELDEYLRDEDLCIVLLSQFYLNDGWLTGELHALLTLENKLRPNFVLPVLLENLDQTRIPEECLTMTHVDFRKIPKEQRLSKVLEEVDRFDVKPRLSIFISHSEKDKDIAAALIELLLKAFNLTDDEVLCSSVDGHRLPLSGNTDEIVRRKIRESKVFICVATKNSIGNKDCFGSFYVAAELGARWGMKRYLALLLAGGASGSWLKAPFSNLNALSCENHLQVLQMIREISPIVGGKPQPPESYFKELDELVLASRENANA